MNGVDEHRTAITSRHYTTWHETHQSCTGSIASSTRLINFIAAGGEIVVCVNPRGCNGAGRVHPSFARGRSRSRCRSSKLTGGIRRVDQAWSLPLPYIDSCILRSSVLSPPLIGIWYPFPQTSVHIDSAYCPVSILQNRPSDATGKSEALLPVHRVKRRHSNFRSHYNLYVGGNTAHCVKLSGEDLSRSSNKIEAVGSRNCPYYHYLAKAVVPC